MIISLYAYYKSLKGNWMGWSRIQTKYTQIQMCCVPDVLKSERKKYHIGTHYSSSTRLLILILIRCHLHNRM